MRGRNSAAILGGKRRVAIRNLSSCKSSRHFIELNLNFLRHELIQYNPNHLHNEYILPNDHFLISKSLAGIDCQDVRYWWTNWRKSYSLRNFDLSDLYTLVHIFPFVLWNNKSLFFRGNFTYITIQKKLVPRLCGCFSAVFVFQGAGL